MNTSLVTDAASVKSTSGASGATSAKDIQDRFLTLLVTQMKNQDPLNPLDNAQVTNQLAQVSTVTGVENLNVTMKSLLDQMAAMQTLQATSMVGRDVLVPGNVLTLGKDGYAAGAVDLTDPIDGARITIKDAAGVTVRDLAISARDAGLMTFEWDGLADSGQAAAAGKYTFTVTATKNGEPAKTESMAVGRVLGVVRDSTGKTALNVEGMGSKTLDEVKQVM